MPCWWGNLGLGHCEDVVSPTLVPLPSSLAVLSCAAGFHHSVLLVEERPPSTTTTAGASHFLCTVCFKPPMNCALLLGRVELTSFQCLVASLGSPRSAPGPSWVFLRHRFFASNPFLRIHIVPTPSHGSLIVWSVSMLLSRRWSRGGACMPLDPSPAVSCHDTVGPPNRPVAPERLRSLQRTL